MAQLAKDIEAYDRIRDDLEAKHDGEWVVIHDQQLVGTFLSLQAAAELAVQRFGRGPYLIRQVGQKPFTLSASVLYRPVYA